MRIFQTIKKVFVTAGGSGNGFIASVVGAGLAMTNRFTLLAGEVKAGIASSISAITQRGAPTNVGVQSTLLGATGSAQAQHNPALALTPAPSSMAPDSTQFKPGLSLMASLREVFGSSAPVNPGFATSLLGAGGDPARPAANPALALSEVISQFNTPKMPAFTSKLGALTLTRRVGGNAVAETAVGGRTDWASDANAISGTDGVHDGSNATFAGNALGARGGQLELSYADHTSKERLRITSAKLYFYGSVAGTLANNADVQLKWDTGSGAFTTLQTITGDNDFSVTPIVHDVTASFNSWAGYNALRAAVSASSALGETWTSALDAIEIEIVAEYKYVEDYSGNARDGAVLGRVLPTVVAGTSGFGNRLEFDGVDRNDASSGVVSPAIACPTAWTLECKFRKDVNGVTSVPCSWVDWGGTGDAVQLSHQAGNLLQIQVFKAGAFKAAINTLATVSIGEHVVRAAYNGVDTLYAFLDGVLQGTYALAAADAPTNPMKVWAGRINWPAGSIAAWPYAFDGAVDEVRLSDVCRSTADYTVDSAPFATDANTLLLWHMDEILPA